jgi:PilZ domain
VTQRRRETRHYFSAIAEIVDVSSQAEFVSVTRNLRLSGCLVKTTTAFPKETKVRVRITFPGIEFGAIGKVGAHGPGAAPEGVAWRRLPGRGE